MQVFFTLSLTNLINTQWIWKVSQHRIREFQAQCWLPIRVITLGYFSLDIKKRVLKGFDEKLKNGGGRSTCLW